MDRKTTKGQRRANPVSTQKRIEEYQAFADEGNNIKELLGGTEEKYKRLFNYMVCGVAVYRAIDDGNDFIFIDFNAAGERIENIKKEEIIGKRVTEAFPAVKEFGIFDVFQRVWKTGEAEYFPARIYKDKRDPGSWRENWVYKLPDGEIVAVYNDITERKRDEEALNKTNRALLILSHCNQALIHSNGETELLNEVCRVIVEIGNYRFAWVGFAQHDKYKSILPAAKNGYEKGYLDTAKITWANNGQKNSPTSNAVKTSKPSVARNISEVFNEHWSNEASKRGYASAISLPLIADGKTLGVLNIYAAEPDAFDREEIELLSEMSNDLAFGINALRHRAEHLRAEEEIRESEKRYRDLYNEAPIAYFTVGKNGRIIMANKRAGELLGYTKDELSDREVFTLYPDTPQGKEKAEEIFRRFSQGDSIFGEELEMLRSDGKKIRIRLSVTPILNNKGQAIASRSTVIDITAQNKAEAELRESERRFRELADSIAGIFFAMDKELRCTYWNKASEKLTGIPGEKALGKSICEIFPDNAETKKAMEQYNEVIRSKEPAVFISEYCLGDRDYIFEINAYPSGEGIAVFCRDITERERMQEALMESEERFSKAFRASPDMIVIYSLKDGKYIEVNDSFIRTTGYSREEIIGHTVDDLDLWVNPREQERMTRLLDENGRMRDEDYSYRMNSGKISIWRCSAEIINLSGESCVIAVASDITERKKAEASLRESEERSRVILESIPQGVIFSDVDGKIIEINNAVRRMHKYEHKEEIVGRQFLELIPEVDHARISDNYKETLEAGYSGALLYNMLKKDGSLFNAELTAAVIKNDAGTPVGFVTVTEDISGRKNIEEQIRELEVLREVDNLRSQLLSNVSHELRTPLTSIKGFVSTLLRTDAEWSSEEQRDFLEIVNQEADRLTRLISDLLDMSRLDAGALKLNRDIHHVSTVLESIESRLGSLTCGRRLLKNIPFDLPPVFVDEMRIGQVLTNLIENAIKYSPEGCDIVIEARPIRDDVVISVIDKGAGIPYELIDKVFDRFYQTESIVTGRKSGTGLGLSICRGIIEAHGGRIWVESKLGEGSNFSFSLPIDNEEDHG